MGDTKDLQEEDGIKKMQEMVKKNMTCMFCTDIQSGEPFETRPMSTQKVDDDGTFWFLSDKDSEKNRQIRVDDNVQLLYASPSHEGFMSVAGHATISQDRAKIKELWAPIAKTWFTQGVDDPRISVIRVTPSSAYYWDTKHGKMISMIRILASMVSGKSDDDGIEGVIRP